MKFRPLPVIILSATFLTHCAMPPGGSAFTETRPALQTEGNDGVYTIRRAEASGSAEIFPVQAAFNVARASATLDDTARMLAGLSAQGVDAYADVRATAAWREHARKMDETWRGFESRHARPIRAWSAREISDLRHCSSVFYPFSGPDFLFADAFFPSAETFVLCGLESAEPLPDLTSLTMGDIATGLDGLRGALNNVMQYSFFITKDMRNDLQATRFRGVLPVILVFLARGGHSVETADTIKLDAAGNPALVKNNGSAASGLMIRSRSGWGGTKRVFYLRQDLSNAGIRPGSPFLSFVSSLGSPPAFTKSASYLMHEESFSGIRGFILQNCRALVQDPSGIPFRHFASAGWDMRLYGGYQTTLDMFKEHVQPDLIEAYRNDSQPINFGIGYLYQPETTSLMVGRARR